MHRKKVLPKIIAFNETPIIRLIMTMNDELNALTAHFEALENKMLYEMMSNKKEGFDNEKSYFDDNFKVLTESKIKISEAIKSLLNHSPKCSMGTQNSCNKLVIGLLSFEIKLARWASLSSTFINMSYDMKVKIHETLKLVILDGFTCAQDKITQNNIIFLYDIYMAIKGLPIRLDPLELIRVFITKFDDDFVRARAIEKFNRAACVSSRTCLIDNHDNIRIMSKIYADYNNIPNLSEGEKIELIYINWLYYNKNYLIEFFRLTKKFKQRPFIISFPYDFNDVNYVFEMLLARLKKYDERVIKSLFIKEEELFNQCWHKILAVLNSINYHYEHGDINANKMRAILIKHIYGYSLNQLNQFNSVMVQCNEKLIRLTPDTMRHVFSRITIWKKLSDECRVFSQKELNVHEEKFSAVLSDGDGDKLDLHFDSMLGRGAASKLLHDKPKLFQHQLAKFNLNFFERLVNESINESVTAYNVDWEPLFIQSEQARMELLQEEQILNVSRLKSIERLKELSKPRTIDRADLPNESKEVTIDEPYETVIEQNKSNFVKWLESHDEESFRLAKSLFNNSQEILRFLKARSLSNKPLSDEKLQFCHAKLVSSLNDLESLNKLFSQYQLLLTQLSSGQANVKESGDFSIAFLEEKIDSIRSKLNEAGEKLETIYIKVEQDLSSFIGKVGWIKYVELGLKNKLEGKDVSTRTRERRYIRSFVRDFLPALVSLQPVAQVKEINICAKVVWPDKIKNYFYQFRALPGKLFLCDDVLFDFLLYQKSEFTSVTFITTCTNPSKVLEIDNRFRSVEHNSLLYRLNDDGKCVDLYFSALQMNNNSIYDWHLQVASGGKFTAFSLTGDADGNIVDVSGRGWTDLKSNCLSMIELNVPLVLEQDPVLCLIAMNNILNGFKPDVRLEDALHNWQLRKDFPDENLKLEARECLQLIETKQKVAYTDLLIKYDFLKKMFNIENKKPDEALDELEAKLGLRENKRALC